MTFFIMVIALSVIVSISPFIYNEIQIIKDLGNSTVSFYGADSGIEKVLYYDRHLRPSATQRGLCALYPLNTATNPQGCPDAVADRGQAEDESLYCNNQTVPEVLDPANYPYGCSLNSCNSCKISFTTTFDNIEYSVVASTYPGEDGKTSVLDIESKGMFGNTSRQINVQK